MFKNMIQRETHCRGLAEVEILTASLSEGELYIWCPREWRLQSRATRASARPCKTCSTDYLEYDSAERSPSFNCMNTQHVLINSIV